MPYFDFHIHPALKCLFSGSDTTPGFTHLSPWVPLDKSKIPFLLRWCTEFPDILQSQGNLAQLVNTDCNLIVVALYMPEHDILKADLIQQSTTGPLQVYLEKGRIDQLLATSPFQLLTTQHLLTLQDPTPFGVTDRHILLIRSGADYQPADTSTIHIVCSVEGCHTLSSRLQQYDPAEIIDNLDLLRTSVSVLSLNLTHMEQSTLCNHAFGMQFLPGDNFRPKGNGISADGIRVLTHCYQQKIMIDIKHMSLAARQQLYHLRASDHLSAINQPVIRTHAGFTGISWKEIPAYLSMQRPFRAGYTQLWQGKPVKYGGNALRPAFNASSINLYDEDIFNILTSGGMIGLSLDKRILGYQQFEEVHTGRNDFPLETEYISNLERSAFFGNDPDVQLGAAFDNDQVLTWDDIWAGGQVNPALGDYHLRYFMAHILHVIVVARHFAYDDNKALTQLCIGADFDGLINPVWCCSTCTDLPGFKAAFIKAFPAFAKESQVALPSGFDIGKFADGLFYTNGSNFVLQRLAV
ncbi:MAG TPA: hypothetical protein VHE34_09480 [Puia sp.]|uniref:hypothetical protein n=1 Tax=Puia sp. TaxID=2045100 RepID=UPI002CA1AA8B|nr:hypothetical protein [Puia sp.]HVU95445.1 hypothetical protein [Puia sp.]